MARYFQRFKCVVVPFFWIIDITANITSKFLTSVKALRQVVNRIAKTSVENFENIKNAFKTAMPVSLFWKMIYTQLFSENAFQRLI